MTGDADSSRLLKKAGLRSTAVRERVLAMLLGAGRSLSHRELVDRLEGFDRITIFRSLKMLKKAGLVHAVQGIDGTLRYLVNQTGPDSAVGSHAKRAPSGDAGCPGGHPHFLCLECGAMSCLADQELPRVEVPEGAVVRGKQLLVYGHCQTCAARLRGTPPASNCPEV